MYKVSAQESVRERVVCVCVPNHTVNTSPSPRYFSVYLLQKSSLFVSSQREGKKKKSGDGKMYSSSKIKIKKIVPDLYGMGVKIRDKTESPFCTSFVEDRSEDHGVTFLRSCCLLDLLVDKDNLINYPLVICSVYLL